MRNVIAGQAPDRRGAHPPRVFLTGRSCSTCVSRGCTCDARGLQGFALALAFSFVALTFGLTAFVKFPVVSFGAFEFAVPDFSAIVAFTTKGCTVTVGAFSAAFTASFATFAPFLLSGRTGPERERQRRTKEAPRSQPQATLLLRQLHRSGKLHYEFVAHRGRGA